MGSPLSELGGKLVEYRLHFVLNVRFSLVLAGLCLLDLV